MLDVGATPWMVFLGFVIICLLLDAFSQRSKQEMGPRRAVVLSILWVLAGVGVGAVIAAKWGSGAGTEYLAGFTIEKMLSVDNLAVISAFFTMQRIPTRLQKRVLTYGIIGAIAFRAVFVLAGASILHRFEIVGAFFAVVLLWTAWKMVASHDDEQQGDSRAVRYLQRKNLLHAGFDGDRFTTKINGRRMLTTLGLAVLLVELTDLVFAVDSVPAVLAVSPDPFIASTSNGMAVPGLRPLSSPLATAGEKFRYLNQTLAVVLGFVGVKMFVAAVSTPVFGHHYAIPVGWSLGIVAGCFATGLALSFRKERSSLAFERP